MLSQIFCSFSEMCVHKPYVCGCMCACMCVGVCVCAQKAHLTYLMKERRQWVGKRYLNMTEKLPAKETSFLLKSPYILKCHRGSCDLKAID